MKTQYDYWKEDHNRIMTEMGMVEKWVPYYCNFPRQINSRWYWRTTVYRKWILLSPSGGFWKYGDDFDRLKDL
jgi:hypothetical protein